MTPRDVSGQLEHGTHLLEVNGEWESCASAGHGCLVSNQGWDKREMVSFCGSAFVGELGRRGHRSVVSYVTF